MRLGWITDPHLDFADESAREVLVHQVKAAGCDRLLVTGDIAAALTFRSWIGWLRAATKLHVSYVLGNHDYYGSSIEGVRKGQKDDAGSRQTVDVHYLPDGKVDLGAADLVGVDGWADGRRGEPGHFMIGDDVYIKELINFDGGADTLRVTRHRFRIRREHADADAHALTMQLISCEKDKVIVATHVPPWTEAAWHMGKHSEWRAQPYFVCVAVGRAIQNFAAEHPEKRFMVLCGHSHSPGHAQIADNLEVFTGEAHYRRPALAGVIDVEHFSVLR